jgi:hypothetical protein
MPVTPSRGPRGYPDFQRTENWDGPIVTELVEETIPEGKVKGTGLFDCSRYAATSGYVEMTAGSMFCVAEWYTAEAGGALIGKRAWKMTPTAGSKGTLRLTNLGPWCGITFHALVGGCTVKYAFQLTNRLPTQEAIPETEQIHRNSSVYKAAEQKVFKLTELATGTAHVVIDGLGGHAANIELLGENASAEEYPLGYVNMTTEIGALPTVGEIHVPLAPLTVVVSNGGNEQTLQTQVIVAP